tara:strand:+ start:2357 stop:2629 length:273 start_codon:yes stop_codon:yes gene_type:complete
MATTTFAAGTVIVADWLNDVNAVVYSQGYVVATSGQTVFTIPFTCSLTLPLSVHIDGVKQLFGQSYTRTSSTEITFTEGVHVGGIVEFTG